MNGVLLFAALQVGIVPISLVGSSAQVAQLRVSFIGCAASSAQSYLNVFDLAKSRNVAYVKMEPFAESGMGTQTLSLPSGYYAISVGRLPCTASRFVALLPGMDRTIVLKGGDSIHLSEGLRSIAGEIPDSDFLVTADCLETDRKLSHYTADIQSGAYYFDELQGPSTCEVNIATRNRPNVSLSTSKLRPGGPQDNPLTIMNVRWDSFAPGGGFISTLRPQ